MLLLGVPSEGEAVADRGGRTDPFLGADVVVVVVVVVVESAFFVVEGEFGPDCVVPFLPFVIDCPALFIVGVVLLPALL